MSETNSSETNSNLAAENQTAERRVGSYVLEQKLGEGGMAEVWKARHQVLGTYVAIKFLSAGYAGTPDVEQRFLNEGKKQARLFHPNIVSAYDFIYADGRSYLIMKFIASGVQASPAMIRSPSFSRSGSSTTTIMRPRFISSIASGMLANSISRWILRHASTGPRCQGLAMA